MIWVVLKDFCYNSGGNPYTMGHLPGLKNDRNEETLYESNADGMQQQP
jgi:hypothetical protein